MAGEAPARPEEDEDGHELSRRIAELEAAVARSTVDEFEFEPDLLGGVGVIRFDALELNDNLPLYANLNERKIDYNRIRAIAIPYYAWANRGKSSMLVWLPLAGNRGEGSD